MAATVQTLSGGARNVVLKITVSGSANTDTVIYDGATDDPNLSLVEAQWAITGTAATIEWDADTDVTLIECSAGHGFFLFEEGVPNNAGTGKTGDVTITNLDTLTSGVIYLKFKKS